MFNTASLALLGDLTPAAFLRRHWQKRPLLVSGAIADPCASLTPSRLFELAGRDDVESRLVMREGRRWSLEHGPFSQRRIKGMPSRNWTLLVQGVNLHDADAEALLRRFAFIPYARLDDLMVSYAAPGGGVGAHFDSYDVFLLQGRGRRRWRISQQKDLSLKPSSALKVLARFKPTKTWTLDPGDMLYLPPDCAHEGVALDTCMTYSIGFRAPSSQELATSFLDWLRDAIQLEGRFADPTLAVTLEPARLGGAMRAQCSEMIAAIRWNEEDIARFLGAYLTEPKPHVVFDPPARPASRSRFTTRSRREGIRLDARTQLLYDEKHVFVNGNMVAWPRRGGATLRQLANRRSLSAAELRRDEPIELLYEWYCDGFLQTD